MFNKVYNLFGFIFCKKSVLKKEIKNIVKVSQQAVKDDLELEIEARVTDFLKGLQTSSSEILRRSNTEFKIIFDSAGRLGWSNILFPKDQFGIIKERVRSE